MGILLKVLSGLARRLLGGWLSTKKIISERGIQWIIAIVLYTLACLVQIHFARGYNTWLFDLLPEWLFIPCGVLLLVISESRGHFPSFQCGTESMEYIQQELAKGRKIPYKKTVDKIAKYRGFDEYNKEWCFWQLLLCKTVWLIPVSFFFGMQFIFIGVLVTFAYNACYWIQFKSVKNVLITPTNFGEFIQGWFYMSALLMY